jgi:hypothetical protein
MFVNQLGLAVTAQQNREIVKPGYDPLKLYAFHEKHRDCGLVLAQIVEENILQIIRLIGHIAPIAIGRSSPAHAPLRGVVIAPELKQ